MTDAVRARGLVKHYGQVKALDGIDVTVPQGSVLGLLGPNGAGKTTAVRILATLLTPDAGTAEVAGVDLLKDPREVRRRIGLSGQYAAVDEYLTGFENLDMIGRLYHLGRKASRERARELLAQFSLEEAGDRIAKTYSGGMRRRLDLAGALVANPPVLFLDEPTTGLDPRSRNDLWDILRGLVRDGTTVILTTQYLEEADQLADDIVVLDHGRTVAHGSPDELKQQIGNDRVDVKVPSVNELDHAARALESYTSGPPSFDHDELTATIPIVEGVSLMQVMRALDAAGVDALDLNRRQASLDDVFLTLTSPGDAAAPDLIDEEVSA